MGCDSFNISYVLGSFLVLSGVFNWGFYFSYGVGVYFLQMEVVVYMLGLYDFFLEEVFILELIDNFELCNIEFVY